MFFGLSCLLVPLRQTQLVARRASVKDSKTIAYVPNESNAESLALRDTCATYLQVKDGNLSLSDATTEQAASFGFCKGFFRGFMSGSARVITEPDEHGRIQEFVIAEGTTYDQAIRIFSILVKGRPDLLREDASVVIMLGLKASGLATLKSLPGTFVKKH